MISINQLTLSGRLTRDPETKQTSGGKTVTNFSVATDTQSKTDADGSKTAFFDVETWEKVAEYASHLKKGQRVVLTGSLGQSRWKDDQAKSYSKVRVIAASVYPLDFISKGDSDSAETPASNKEDSSEK